MGILNALWTRERKGARRGERERERERASRVEYICACDTLLFSSPCCICTTPSSPLEPAAACSSPVLGPYHEQVLSSRARHSSHLLSQQNGVKVVYKATEQPQSAAI